MFEWGECFILNDIHNRDLSIRKHKLINLANKQNNVRKLKLLVTIIKNRSVQKSTFGGKTI